MKDEFDDATPDMFERSPEKVKKVARPDLGRKSMFPLTDAAFEEMAKSDAARAERRAARGASSSLDEFNSKVKKVARPDMSARDAAKSMASDAISKASGRGGTGTGGGSGAGGGDLPPGFTPGKKGGKGPIDYKKGGKVAGRLATRGYGIAKK